MWPQRLRVNYPDRPRPLAQQDHPLVIQGLREFLQDTDQAIRGVTAQELRSQLEPVPHCYPDLTRVLLAWSSNDLLPSVPMISQRLRQIRYTVHQDLRIVAVPYPSLPGVQRRWRVHDGDGTPPRPHPLLELYSSEAEREHPVLLELLTLLHDCGADATGLGWTHIRRRLQGCPQPYPVLSAALAPLLANPASLLIDAYFRQVRRDNPAAATLQLLPVRDGYGTCWIVLTRQGTIPARPEVYERPRSPDQARGPSPPPKISSSG